MRATDDDENVALKKGGAFTAPLGSSFFLELHQ